MKSNSTETVYESIVQVGLVISYTLHVNFTRYMPEYRITVVWDEPCPGMTFFSSTLNMCFETLVAHEKESD